MRRRPRLSRGATAKRVAGCDPPGACQPPASVLLATLPMLPPRPRIQLDDPPAASSSQLAPLLDAIEHRSGSCVVSHPGEGGSVDEVDARGPLR